MRSVRVKVGAALAVAVMGISIAGPGAASACLPLEECLTRVPREQRIIIDIVGAGLQDVVPGGGVAGPLQ